MIDIHQLKYIKCDIRITFPDGDKVLCGTILCQDPDPRGWIEGAFRYASGYLDDPRAFPLDPEVLPLSNREFQAKRSTGVHAVFEDCRIDWGRRLLVRKANLERTRQNVPHLLLALGGSGLGALSYESIEDNKIQFEMKGADRGDRPVAPVGTPCTLS